MPSSRKYVDGFGRVKSSADDLLYTYNWRTYKKSNDGEAICGAVQIDGLVFPLLCSKVKSAASWYAYDSVNRWDDMIASNTIVINGETWYYTGNGLAFEGILDYVRRDATEWEILEVSGDTLEEAVTNLVNDYYNNVIASECVFGIDRYYRNIYTNYDLKCYGDVYLNWYYSSPAPCYVDSQGKLTDSSSSRRYKENITDVGEELNPDKLYSLPVRQYNYKEEYRSKGLVSGTQIGIIAEDVAQIYPNACIYNKDGEPESWQDRILIPAMLKLIQEQHEEIEALKSKLDETDKKLSALLS